MSNRTLKTTYLRINLQHFSMLLLVKTLLNLRYQCIIIIIITISGSSSSRIISSNTFIINIQAMDKNLGHNYMHTHVSFEKVQARKQ